MSAIRSLASLMGSWHFSPLLLISFSFPGVQCSLIRQLPARRVSCRSPFHNKNDEQKRISPTLLCKAIFQVPDQISKIPNFLSSSIMPSIDPSILNLVLSPPYQLDQRWSGVGNGEQINGR